MSLKQLDKLWSITGDERLSGSNDSLYFDSIGLNLIDDIKRWEYWCTPMNTACFASTFGDGVHFSFICESGQVFDNSPVVMTIPTAQTTNIIVGENLIDFLSLGCRASYFTLEQIEYQPQSHISLLDSHTYPSDMNKEEINMLQAIESEFDLKPWSNNEERLEELKQKYIGLLQFSVEYYEF